MSLLPGQIIPFDIPIGTVNADGTVTINKNWWLFFYNVALNSIGPSGSITDEGLEILQSSDDDAFTVDAAVLTRQLANLTAQLPADLPAASDYPDIARSLLLAQDSLLVDPAPLAQPVATITVGASPFSYTAPFSGAVAVSGGTVSVIAVIRQGTAVTTGQTAGMIAVSKFDTLKVTYSAAPTMTFLPT